MLDFEIKECLSETLCSIEQALASMEEIHEHDSKTNKCYNMLLEVHEEVRMLYDK